MGSDPEQASLLVDKEALDKLLQSYMDLSAGECAGADGAVSTRKARALG